MVKVRQIAAQWLGLAEEKNGVAIWVKFFFLFTLNPIDNTNDQTQCKFNRQFVFIPAKLNNNYGDGCCKVFKSRFFCSHFLLNLINGFSENRKLGISTVWAKKEAPVDTGAVYQN